MNVNSKGNDVMKNPIETRAGRIVGPAPTVGAAPEGVRSIFAHPGLRRFPRRSRRGISIWGVILGVAVVAFFTLRLVNAYQGVVDNTRGQEVSSTVVQASTAIRRVYANASSFPDDGGDMNPIIFSSAPKNLQNVDGSSSDDGITFPWWNEGGTAATLTATDGAANTFTLSASHLPSGVCETIAAAHIGLADVQRVDIRASSSSNSASTRVYSSGGNETQNNSDAAKIGDLCGNDTAANRAVHIRFRG